MIAGNIAVSIEFEILQIHLPLNLDWMLMLQLYIVSRAFNLAGNNTSR